MNNKIIPIGIIVVAAIILVIMYFLFFRSYTITFDSQGGTWFKTQQVRKNALVKNPGEPTLSGYEFIGWYLNDSEYDFSTPVDSSFTLTAKFKKIEE